ncbi:glycosyltransferase family 4 protein [Nocardioides piscis]|uniref:glycosyltransferase family 4 protein n=1 Tax=Nocardioides piscis TaxID=2714938 RepID=UPI001FE8F55B|nr:glycosyltransferase family 4 protein [Nocardioides piscis]
MCQWYAPEPVTQPGWIVDGLRDAGLDVSVLTAQPNYPSGRVRPGYKAWALRQDAVDKVPVLRTPVYPSHDRSALGRIVNYLSWALSSSLFGWRAQREADVVLVYSSPATAALAPLMWRRMAGLPYVLQIQDLWPDSVFASGFLPGRAGRLVRSLLESMVQAFYRQASGIVVISPGMKDLLVERGVEAEKISLVYNWLPPETMSEDIPTGAEADLRAMLGLPAEAFVVMYAGNHGDAQGLDAVVRAMADVRLNAPGRPVHLVLVGDGVAKQGLMSLAESMAPARVHFLGFMTRDDLSPLTRQANAQLVSLIKNPLFEVTMPSKIQSVLSAAQPVLACAAGDLARVVRESGAGVVAPPGDTAKIADALVQMVGLSSAELTAMGERGRHYYEGVMKQAVGVDRLAHALSAASEDRRA